MNRVLLLVFLLFLLCMLCMPALAKAVEVEPPGVQNALAILEESVRLRQSDPVRSASLASDAAALLGSALPGGGIELPHAQRALGNAWLLAGEPGRAVLAYRRAELARPGDPIIRSSLEHARALAGVEGVAAISSDDWRSWLLRWRPFVPRVWVFWVGTALSVSGCWLIAARIVGLLGARVTVPALFVTAVGALGVAVTSLEARLELPGASVVVRASDGRTGPHADLYPPALDRSVPAGTEVRVLEVRDGWKRCSIGSLQAWLPASSVELIRP
jgi:hypothetical protein